MIDNEQREFLKLLINCDLDAIYEHLEKDKIEIPEEESVIWKASGLVLTQTFCNGDIKAEEYYDAMHKIVLKEKNAIEKEKLGFGGLN